MIIDDDQNFFTAPRDIVLVGLGAVGHNPLVHPYMTNYQIKDMYVSLTDMPDLYYNLIRLSCC